MLIYEVNLAVQEETAQAFADWLRPHMEEVVRCGGFEKAEWFSRDSVEEGIADTSQVYWTVQYRVKDRKRLEIYLEKHAPRLRQDGLRRFPGKFTAKRRILEVIE